MESRTKADQTALYELERQKGVVRDRVRDVAARRHNSAYIFGRRGTSKTHMVRATLDALDHHYAYHSGHLTAMGFFDLIGKHPADTIVLDDVSSLFRDKVGQQLLLAAPGTPSAGDRTRVVSYRRRNRDEVVRFTGGLIALSNIPLHNDDVLDAIKFRTKPLCWDPTEAQLAAMMRDAVKSGWRGHGVALKPAECREVVAFLVDQCRTLGAQLDLRLLFDGALVDFAAGKKGEHETDWRDLTTMAVREQVRDLRFSGRAKSRAEQVALERQIPDRIRRAHGTRPEQVAAWVKETRKSERAFDRRSSEVRRTRW